MHYGYSNNLAGSLFFATAETLFIIGETLDEGWRVINYL